MNIDSSNRVSELSLNIGKYLNVRIMDWNLKIIQVI